MLLGVGAMLWVAWVGGTAVGALAGQAIGDPSAFGLDGAFAALFVALLAAQLTDRRRVAAAVGGAAIAARADPVHAAGHPDHRRDGSGRASAGGARERAVGGGARGRRRHGPAEGGRPGRRLGTAAAGARRRELLEMVAPAILAALVVTETFASGRSLVLDARLAGVAARHRCGRAARAALARRGRRRARDRARATRQLKRASNSSGGSSASESTTRSASSRP